MANLNDILKLVNAGFTKAEIASIMKLAAPQDGEAVNVSGGANETNENEDRSQVPNASNSDESSAAASPDFTEQLKGLNAAIENLSRQVTAANINNSNMPQTDTAEDILARIINPPIYNDKE